VSDIPGEISELLAKWETGDKEALRLVFPLIYKDLRRLAHARMRQQRPDHTLQPTALVHEAYMRLENRRPAHFQNRNHFVAVCALLMRQVLVQYERVRLAEKRGGSAEKVTLDDALCLANGRGVDLIALDDALKGLARLDPQQSRIVELRFFGGLSIEETAAELGISPATVKRLWSTARLWLYREMSDEASTLTPAAERDDIDPLASAN
jgi:RNA polymerase sigma factor (TIGR02999 family)